MRSVEDSLPTSDRCPEGCCFDLATIVNKNAILLKVEEDVSKFSLNLALELGLIADKLLAVPLIIGSRSNNRRMMDHVLYVKYGIHALNARTFFDIILNGNPPLVEAKQGGYVAHIDCELLKHRMREMKVTRGDLSNLLGISKKALYAYEKGSTKCSLTIALKLERILGAPIIKALNPFEWTYRYRYSSTTRALMKRRIGETFEKLTALFERLKLTYVFTRNAPFDFLLEKEDLKIIGNVFDGDERSLNRHKVAKSIANLLGIDFLSISLHPSKHALSVNELQNVEKLGDLLRFSL